MASSDIVLPGVDFRGARGLDRSTGSQGRADTIDLFLSYLRPFRVAYLSIDF